MSGPDRRAPLSLGIEWASRVTSLGLEVVIPALVGIFLDRRYGWKPVGTLVGTGLGFALMMVHLLQIARRGTSD